MKTRYEYNGERLTLPQIAKASGVAQTTLYRRLVVEGCSVDEATSGRRKPRTAVLYRGRTLSLAELARETGIKYGTLRRRISIGMTAEEAVAKQTLKGSAGTWGRKPKYRCPYPDCDSCPYPDCII